MRRRRERAEIASCLPTFHSSTRMTFTHLPRFALTVLWITTSSSFLVSSPPLPHFVPLTPHIEQVLLRLQHRSPQQHLHLHRLRSDQLPAEAERVVWPSELRRVDGGGLRNRYGGLHGRRTGGEPRCGELGRSMGEEGDGCQERRRYYPCSSSFFFLAFFCPY